jgi:hypothetical protein
MKLRIKSTTLTLTLISWLQIVGGIAGFFLMASLMLGTATINGAVLLIILIGLALFLFSIYSGKRLLTDDNKISGVVLSIINQALQIFQWHMFGYGLSYSSGAEITLGFQEMTIKFNFAAIFSTFRMSINSEGEFFLTANFIAIFITIVLADILKELKDQRAVKIENLEIPANGSEEHW